MNRTLPVEKLDPLELARLKRCEKRLGEIETVLLAHSYAMDEYVGNVQEYLAGIVNHRACLVRERQKIQAKVGRMEDYLFTDSFYEVDSSDD